MKAGLRELMVLLGLAAMFFAAFLVEPEWYLQEAHWQCGSEPAVVFESMDACGVGQEPGCLCFRPVNIWTFVFWISVLLFLGTLAAVFLRSRFLPGAVFLGATLVFTGAGAMLTQPLVESAGAQEWEMWKLTIAVYVTIVLFAFSICRLVRYLVRRRAAPPK